LWAAKLAAFNAKRGQISSDSTFFKASDMGMLVAARLKSETKIQEKTNPHG
jgi:hypothetical protein